MYILELVQKVRDLRSVANDKHEMTNPVENEAPEVALLGYIFQDPTLSKRKLSTILGIKRSSIQRILRNTSIVSTKYNL